MIIKRDEAFMVVCELRTQIDVNKLSIGTGMFVSSPAGNDKTIGWIVTASHVARATNDNTCIVISTKDGKAETINLKAFGAIGWKHHPIGDISAFQIQINPLNLKFLEGRFFPYDHINIEQKSVSRDFELTAIGFPRGLGTDNLFSPFTFRSYASSGFVTLKRADTKTDSAFFCLENPSVGGYSGCPVFDLGYETNGTMMVTRNQTWCHGFMHGTMCDDTGGKIAMVTPAFYLKDLID